ncbi:MAG TPA: molybdenum cofactor guanylyltransferase [Chloroflexia bacterium]|nr:molybdenum cofactor guanylyltransferase [Chloroflexia bacterium]
MNPANQPQQSIGAAILAGGANRRMGQNKALLRLTPDGPTLIEVVVARLTEAGYPAPLLIANASGDYAFLGLPAYPDDVEGKGALGGILTALRRAPYERVLVVACDMPALNPALLRHMASLPSGNDAYVPTWVSTSGEVQVEPLHAIYSRTSIPVIERRISEDHLKLGDLLAALNVRYLTEPEVREYDPSLTSFSNINTPQEWASLAAQREFTV